MLPDHRLRRLHALVLRAGRRGAARTPAAGAGPLRSDARGHARDQGRAAPDLREDLPRSHAGRRPHQCGHAAVHGVGPQGLPLLRRDRRPQPPAVRAPALPGPLLPRGRHRRDPGAVPAQLRQGRLPHLLRPEEDAARCRQGARPVREGARQEGVRAHHGLLRREGPGAHGLQLLHLRRRRLHAPLLRGRAGPEARRVHRRAAAGARRAAAEDTTVHWLRLLGRLHGRRALPAPEAAAEGRREALLQRRQGPALHGAVRQPEAGGCGPLLRGELQSGR
mmetsp:Transcript_83438/g.269914  ORF Transcript_83438/g.269914 Transcript_83438/m.269914 type:complete len:278 (+) Transcript_83438:645-1478(+)